MRCDKCSFNVGHDVRCEKHDAFWLAMLCLQSKRYETDVDFKDATDAVLRQTYPAMGLGEAQTGEGRRPVGKSGPSKS